MHAPLTTANTLLLSVCEQTTSGSWAPAQPFKMANRLVRRKPENGPEADPTGVEPLDCDTCSVMVGLCGVPVATAVVEMLTGVDSLRTRQDTVSAGFPFWL